MPDTVLNTLCALTILRGWQHSYFTDEGIEAEWRGKLPKVTQLGSDGATGNTVTLDPLTLKNLIKYVLSVASSSESCTLIFWFCVF